MEVDRKRVSETFYVITLHSTKKNSLLLDANGNLKKNVRRNIDYSIIPRSAWMECKEQYDAEIPVCNIYNLFISFSCHGLSYKNIYVHGVEIIFDVVQALFVNKMFGIESFRRMFEVKWNSQTVDPMVNFEWFGSDSKKIVLTVERKTGYVREEPSGVLDSIMVNDPGNSFCSLAGRSGDTDSPGSSARRSTASNARHHVTREDISFYRKIYTSTREVHGKGRTSESYGSPEEPESEKLSSTHSGYENGTVENRQLQKPQTSELPAHVPQMHQGSVGLMNIGNTCYMSSSIQCLNNCMTFSNFFVYYHSALDQAIHRSSVETPFVELKHNKHFHDNLEILSSWTNLIMTLNTQSIVSPKDLKIAMGSKNTIFKEFKEQDAAEFIEAILTYLHEGLCYRGEGETTAGSNTPSVEDTPSSAISECSTEVPESSGSELPGCNRLPWRDSAGIAEKHFGECPEIVGENTATSEGRDDCGPVQGHHFGDEDMFSREFDNLINSEKSIVSKLFYGMYTNVMECGQCGFKKHKSDLMMMLPLPIPREVLYHSSVTLIRFSGEMLTKILAPLDFTVRKVLEQVKAEHNIRDGILPVEYLDNHPVDLICETRTIRSIFNRIHLYEYSSSKKLCLCRMFHYRYLFFKQKLPTDVLVEECDKKMSIFNRLRVYFAKNLNFEEFLSQITISHQGVDKIYNLPVIEVVFKDPKLLFGANFEVLSRPVSQKSDDLNLKDCLNHCFRSEPVELYCESCKRMASYEIRSRLTKHPRYLIIHLKRFSYSICGTKINTFVDFPVDSFRIESHVYRLVGTSNHLEIGLGYGHYVSYVRKGSQWYCCNDSVISKSVSPDKATAYILFYEKIY